MRTRLWRHFRLRPDPFVLCLYFYNCVVVFLRGTLCTWENLRVAGLRLDKHFSA